MGIVLCILLAIILMCLHIWIAYKNPDTARQDRISDDLFDMALKVGKEKREGKDISANEAYYDDASKMVVDADVYDIAGEDPFDVAMKIAKEKRVGKDTSDKEKYFELIEKNHCFGDETRELLRKL